MANFLEPTVSMNGTVYQITANYDGSQNRLATEDWVDGLFKEQVIQSTANQSGYLQFKDTLICYGHIGSIGGDNAGAKVTFPKGYGYPPIVVISQIAANDPNKIGTNDADNSSYRKSDKTGDLNPQDNGGASVTIYRNGETIRTVYPSYFVFDCGRSEKRGYHWIAIGRKTENE